MNKNNGVEHRRWLTVVCIGFSIIILAMITKLPNTSFSNQNLADTPELQREAVLIKAVSVVSTPEYPEPAAIQFIKNTNKPKPSIITQIACSSLTEFIGKVVIAVLTIILLASRTFP